MKHHPRKLLSAFTLTETLIASAVGLIVSVLALSYLRVGTILFAKNIGTNLSSNELRGSLDRLGDRIQNAVNMPVLIDASGAAIAIPPLSGTPGVYRSPAAAGICYDRLLGEPYVVTHPGGAGLGATTTTLKVTFSTNIYASPPIPTRGDVLLIDSAPAGLRPVIETVTKDGAVTAAGLQAVTLTFSSPLGKTISWDAGRPKTARLIRREALIVMPAGTRNELRRYSWFEAPVPAATLTDPTKYSVLTRQVGTKGAELTPFSIMSTVTATSSATVTDKLVNLDFRIRAGGFEKVLANKEVNDFSTFVRVQTVLTSRLRPRN